MSDSDSDQAEDWDLPLQADAIPCNSKSGTSCMLGVTGSNQSYQENHERTIIHIDIDCFYAQVEMIRNPDLRTKPLGIQQKNIVVTCNYVAREHGVTKLSYIKEAEKKCPDLVLVNGEDLTHYREMSYKITNFLLKYTPIVERLGFDENFLDVTDMVRIRLNGSTEVEVEGHTYGNGTSGSPVVCGCGCHVRLAVGTQIAADIRSAMQEELGITCCAGIAWNKLLSKLVAGAHKPNQQTVLFPEQVSELMPSLEAVRAIPGIGSSTSKRLATLGITTVTQLQEVDQSVLADEFGESTAHTMKLLSQGIDQSPVVTTGQAQSISDEDSFRKCQDVEDVRKRISGLLDNLLKRLDEDGRLPEVIRLSLRKLNSEGQWSRRESRQCKVSRHIFTPGAPMKNEKLLDIAMELFHKIIDTKKSFHLTLLNLCFTKFETSPADSGTISAYFSANTKNSNTTCHSNKTTETPSNLFWEDSDVKNLEEGKPTPFSPSGKIKLCSQSSFEKNSILRWTERRDKRPKSPNIDQSPGTKKLRFSMPGENTSVPEHFDKSVFDALPHDLKQEVLANAELQLSCSRNSGVKSNFQKDAILSHSPHDIINGSGSIKSLAETNSEIGNSFSENGDLLVKAGGISEKCKSHSQTLSNQEGDQNSLKLECANIHPQIQTPNGVVPPDIDRSVFVQLPPDIQRDLITQWSQESSQVKSSKPLTTKKSTTAKSPSVLKYFKKI